MWPTGSCSRAGRQAEAATSHQPLSVPRATVGGVTIVQSAGAGSRWRTPGGTTCEGRLTACAPAPATGLGHTGGAAVSLRLKPDPLRGPAPSARGAGGACLPPAAAGISPRYQRTATADEPRQANTTQDIPASSSTRRAQYPTNQRALRGATPLPPCWPTGCRTVFEEYPVPRVNHTGGIRGRVS